MHLGLCSLVFLWPATLLSALFEESGEAFPPSSAYVREQV